MTIQDRIYAAVFLALFAMSVTASAALAHSTGGDPSLVHRVIDSPATPLLGVGVIGVVAVVWWRRASSQQL